MYFEYVTFPLDRTQQSLDVNYIILSLMNMDFTSEDKIQGFRFWLRDFHCRSGRFYSSQYRNHKDIINNNYERICDIDSSEEDRLIFLKYSGLEDHERDKNNAMSALQKQINAIASELNINKSGFCSIKEVLEDAFTQSLLEIPASIFDELWFNRTISNDKDMCSILRKLDYSDYLKTSHWKNVRASMLLLNNSTCQHPECSAMGESRRGEENSLHVHHLTYKNLGNERYADLSLLCKFHYIEVHAEVSSLKVKQMAE